MSWVYIMGHDALCRGYISWSFVTSAADVTLADAGVGSSLVTVLFVEDTFDFLVFFVRFVRPISWTRQTLP